MAYQVVNPATGKLESEYPTATDAEISDVLARADAGYKSWRRTSLDERAAILRQVAQLYRDRAEELAAIITREMGKTTVAALGEIKFASNIYKYYADNGSGCPGRPGSARPRSGRCSASCRGTTPTTRWPGSRLPT